MGQSGIVLGDMGQFEGLELREQEGRRFHGSAFVSGEIGGGEIQIQEVLATS